MWVIQRIGGGYVAQPGSEHSYVMNIFDARWFSTREEAERHRCPENERIYDTRPIMERLARNAGQ